MTLENGGGGFDFEAAGERHHRSNVFNLTLTMTLPLPLSLPLDARCVRSLRLLCLFLITRSVISILSKFSTSNSIH